MTKDEKLALSDMYMYFKRNTGHAYGFQKYRKAIYEDEICRFSELCLVNKTRDYSSTNKSLSKPSTNKWKYYNIPWAKNER
jgi:hypothetical protein